MNNIFKIYSKEKSSNRPDSIFSIIGRSEPDLTKSLAFLLHYSPDFLKKYLGLVDKDIDLTFKRSLVTAEQKPNVGLDNRRDIAIFLYYQDTAKNCLIVTEAKNLYIKNISSLSITNQLEKYFDPASFSDVSRESTKIAATLTKDKILLKQTDFQNFDRLASITWQDILYLISDIDDYLLQAYKQEIMNSNFIKTYEEEVFCPPVGDTFKTVQELGIYCCPADRSLKDAIYLMPRVPVNKIQALLTGRYGISDFTELKGKGCSVALYKIDNSFIVDSNSLDAIEDETLRQKVQKWLGSREERLKVFVLSERMDFQKPKFTELQNNTWNGYFKLSQVWGDLITKNTNNENLQQAVIEL